MEAAVMSNDGSGDSNERTAPKDRALDAMQTAVARLEEAHEQADNAAEAGAAEHEHVTEFVDVVAKALADGMNEPAGFFAGAVADVTEYHTKTNLKQSIKDKTEEYRGVDRQPLDEFVEGRLESVTVVKTTDHRQGAEYIWDFDTFKVETRSGKDGRGHFAFDQFRNLIHESGGVNLAKPQKDRRGGEAWRDFITSMIDARGKTRRTRGPRTQAYEALSNKLRQRTGYGTPEAALDRTGVWVIRESHDLPEWWAGLSEVSPSDDRDLPPETVNEVRVHESVIQPVLDDADITRSAFYHELAARNLTVPGTSGASMTVYVNGNDERFWTLLPDAGTPRRYIPNERGEQVHTGSLLGESSEPADQQDSQPTSQHTEHAEPDTAGGSDARDGGVGFDSVGDPA